MAYTGKPAGSDLYDVYTQADVDNNFEPKDATILKEADIGTKVGKVLQVVQSVNNTQVVLSATPVQTFTATGTSVTITPSSPNSKILVIAQNSYFHTDGAAQGVGFRLYRGSTALTTELPFTASYSQNSHRHHGYHSIQYLDSPGTTNAVTYNIYGANWTSTSGAKFQYGYGQSPSYIIALEIGA